MFGAAINTGSSDRQRFLIIYIFRELTATPWDRVLVNGGVEIGAELVGGGPQLFIELAEEGLGGTVRH